MNLPLRMRLFAYRILSTPYGRVILRIFSHLIHAKGMGLFKQASAKKPFIVSITIDTESGYVDADERRVWQNENPRAFMGFYKGIKNWKDLFRKYGVKSTFFVSTQCFDSNGSDHEKIASALNEAVSEGHEMGLHMHPDSDFALQKAIGKKFSRTSAIYYDTETKKQMIMEARKMLIKNIRNLRKVVSFRWGNWGLDSGAVEALHQLGFEVDSSATPGIKGHIGDGMDYDWANVDSHYPWLLSTGNYKDVKKPDSGVLELPIATFSLLGLTLRADPVNLELLKGSFDYYYKNSDRSKKPFVFVVISHSPESTYIDGRKTKVIVTMEDFIKHASKRADVRFVPLDDAAHFLRQDT